MNRALVYGSFTLCVVGVYVLVVGYLGNLFRVEENLLGSLFAAGVVAVIFAFLRAPPARRQPPDVRGVADRVGAAIRAREAGLSSDVM